jgi:hypothetical protein
MEKTSIIINCLFVVTLLLWGCSSSSQRNTVFNSQKLIGKYEVDITPIIYETTKAEENDNELDALGKGIARLAASTLHMGMTFYENKKGRFDFEGGLFNILLNPDSKSRQFDYKVVNDTLLWIKLKDETNYEEWGIIKSFSENYDVLEFIELEDGIKKNKYYLRKVVE